MNPAGTLTTLYSLPDSRVRLPLVEGANGFLYSAGKGILRVSLDGQVKRLGFESPLQLLKSSDGRIWGSEWNRLFSFSDGPAAVLSIDAPRNGQRVSQPFVVTGWAVDRSVIGESFGFDTVHLWAFPRDGRPPIFIGASGFGTARPDVAQKFGRFFTNVGFGLTVRNLAPGPYRIVAYAHSKLWDAFDTQATASIDVLVESVATSSPRIQFDTLTQRGSVLTSFAIRGWAVDLASTDKSGIDVVHIYAYPNWNFASSPTFLGVAAYGGGRLDVAAMFGPTFGNSAFALNATLAPGPYTIVAYAHSTATGTFSAEAREITVRVPGAPQMALDSPPNGAVVSQPFLVQGWAVDTDAVSGSGVDTVHVWAYPATGATPVFLGSPPYGGYRYDVSRALDPVAAEGCESGTYPVPSFCPFAFSSFAAYFGSLPPGNYNIVVYAHSSVTGTFSAQRQAAITVR